MNDFISYVLLFGSWHFSSLPVLHVIFHLLRSVRDVVSLIYLFFMFSIRLFFIHT
ncbi:hypothetical protein V6Z12_D11G390800 [Gossypium hirsutum]